MPPRFRLLDDPRRRPADGVPRRRARGAAADLQAPAGEAPRRADEVVRARQAVGVAGGGTRSRPARAAGRAARRERGRDWRPGGEHRDPRQKFNDAKKERNQDRRQAALRAPAGRRAGHRTPVQAAPDENGRRGPRAEPRRDWKERPTGPKADTASATGRNARPARRPTARRDGRNGPTGPKADSPTRSEGTADRPEGRAPARLEGTAGPARRPTPGAIGRTGPTGPDGRAPARLEGRPAGPKAGTWTRPARTRPTGRRPARPSGRNGPDRPEGRHPARLDRNARPARRPTPGAIGRNARPARRPSRRRDRQARPSGPKAAGRRRRLEGTAPVVRRPSGSLTGRIGLEGRAPLAEPSGGHSPGRPTGPRADRADRAGPRGPARPEALMVAHVVLFRPKPELMPRPRSGWSRRSRARFARSLHIRRAMSAAESCTAGPTNS